MPRFGEDYLKQRSHLREMLEHYRLIGPAGSYGAAMIEQTLQLADEAALNGDVGAMCACYLEMERLGNGTCWRIDAPTRATSSAGGIAHATGHDVNLDWRCAAPACA